MENMLEFKGININNSVKKISSSSQKGNKKYINSKKKPLKSRQLNDDIINLKNKYQNNGLQKF